MKKVLSILFIFIFLYNITGYFAVFKILQFKIRQEVEHEIKENPYAKNIVIISIPNKEIASLRWTKQGKEFKYKNELYDIVRRKSTKGKTIFYCFQDKKEKKLFTNLSHHIQIHTTTNTNQRRKANNYIKKLAKDYFFIFKNTSAFFETSHNINYKDYIQAYNSIFIEVLSPPPQFV